MTFVTETIGRIHAGESEAVMIPRLGVQTDRYPLIYCHGASLTGMSAQAAGSGGTKILDLLCRAGWKVICPDLGGLETWGNDTSLARITEARTFATSLGCKSEKVVLVAGSMGNSVAFNYARSNLSSVAAIASFIPVCDLDDIRNNDRASYRGSIDAAWGVTYPAVLPGRANPVTQPSGTFTGLNARLYVASSDTIALPSTATALVSLVGATASVVVASAQGHGDGAIQDVDPDDLISFVETYGR